MPPKSIIEKKPHEERTKKIKKKQAEQRRTMAILLAFVLGIFSLGILFGCFICSAFTKDVVSAAEETTARAECTNPEFKPLDIRTSENALDDELQLIMYEACEEYNVPFALAIAIAEQESEFDADVNASETNDYGLMQINKVNFRRFTDIGINPMTDEGNIKAGVIMLSEAIEKYGDYGLAVMAYNCGDNGAKRLWDKGIYSTDYSEAVISKFEKWDSYIRGV